MTQYKHGAYGALGDTVARRAVAAETVPVYIGTAPAHLAPGSKAGEPVKISSVADAQAKIGMSGDWETYTLCEAVTAHFDAGDEGAGPIYVVNALDPAAAKAKKDTEALLAFAAGKAHIAGDAVILDSIRVFRAAEGGKGEEYVRGEDYAVSYDFAAARAVVSSLAADSPIAGEAVCTYSTVEPGKVTAGDVAAAVGAVDLLYQEQFAVPNLLLAPGWSHVPAVYRALVAAATKINGHWDAYVLADLPLADGAKAVDTVEAAAAWKKANGYDSERSSVFWPMAADIQGRPFHLSTLACVQALLADASNDGVPFAGWSNRAVPVARQLFAEGSAARGFDQRAGNALNEQGITTAVGWGGEWVLWGPHTAAFAHGGPHDARATFATGMRMLFHLTNGFQQRWAAEVDAPMTPALRDRILNGEQEQLDALVAVGALVGSPRILFEAAENPAGSLVEGDFVWDAAVTPTVPLKSATVRVAYTDAGLDSYTEEGE